MKTLIICLVILLAIIILLILAFLIIGHLMFKLSFSRKDPAKEEQNRTVNDPDIKILEDLDFVKEHDKDFKEVFIKAYDGINLAAKTLTSKNKSHKYVIFFHGYRGNIINEFSLSGHTFYDKNYNLIFVEERGNWNSGSNYFTMGPKESLDAISWINYLVNKDSDSEILVFGHSMGAHIVLLTLKYNLPKNVKCVIGDCGYNSLHDQIVHTAKDMLKLPCAKLMVWIGETYAHLFHKMHFNETVSDSVKNNMLPVCLIHGTNDHFVPFYNEDIIYKSFNKDCYVEKHVFEGAAHCCSEAKDLARFHQIITTFADKYIQ